MSEMEEKLGAILNNPQMMQQIMALAHSMNTSSGENPLQQPSEPTPAPDLSNFDPKILHQLGSILQQKGVDRNQTALLSALSPYLSRDRLNRLERAMQASRMAGAASAFLGAGGLQSLGGR